LVRTTKVPPSETVALVSRSLRRTFSMTPSEDLLSLGANYSLPIQPNHILEPSSLKVIGAGRIRDKRLG
jgi:hypothetical protein